MGRSLSILFLSLLCVVSCDYRDDSSKITFTPAEKVIGAEGGTASFVSSAAFLTVYKDCYFFEGEAKKSFMDNVKTEYFEENGDCRLSGPWFTIEARKQEELTVSLEINDTGKRRSIHVIVSGLARGGSVDIIQTAE